MILRICIKDVIVSIAGSRILNNVNLDIEEGLSVGLIGRNGAGKTTLMKTIMGLIRPINGSIILYSDSKKYRLDMLKPYTIAKLGIGYVPQGRYIFPNLTVVENLEVAYGGRLPMNLLDEIFRLFPELDRVKDSMGINLSGGEQQMLSIARALIRRPRILLMDEPLEGLAPKVAKTLKRVLKGIRGSGVGLFVTEPGNVARIKDLVDKVYGIDRGEIIYEGDIDGILEDRYVRERIWGV